MDSNSGYSYAPLFVVHLIIGCKERGRVWKSFLAGIGVVDYYNKHIVPLHAQITSAAG